jgi:hypothetical protein
MYNRFYTINESNIHFIIIPLFLIKKKLIFLTEGPLFNNVLLYVLMLNTSDFFRASE